MIEQTAGLIQSFYRNDGAVSVIVGGQRARPGDTLLLADADVQAAPPEAQAALIQVDDHGTPISPAPPAPSPAMTPEPATVPPAPEGLPVAPQTTVGA